jgi:tRNA 2-thiouridine synthesizing protein A
MDEYDFTGLKCPLPVLKAKRVLKNLDKGKTVVIISDDPASPIDFSHFSENEGYSISIKSLETGKHYFTLSKI